VARPRSFFRRRWQAALHWRGKLVLQKEALHPLLAALVGIGTLQDLKDFLHHDGDLAGVIALDRMRPPPRCLTSGQRLLDALPLVLASELHNIPVVSTPAENRLVGSLSRVQMLAIFLEAIAEISRPAG
jgi:hypothetical protein